MLKSRQWRSNSVSKNLMFIGKHYFAIYGLRLVALVLSSKQNTVIPKKGLEYDR